MKKNKIIQRTLIALLIGIFMLNSISVQASVQNRNQYNVQNNAKINVAKSATKGFDIKYNGKVINYTKKPVSVFVDNKKVNTAMPGIIVNGVSMVPVNTVFAKALKVKYLYDKTKKTITLSNSSNQIKMTINSKVAYVNNKKIAIKDTALVVTLVANKKNYIMVPARFVAQSLGYTYEWNQKKSISSINNSSKDDSDTNDSDSNDSDSKNSNSSSDSNGSNKSDTDSGQVIDSDDSKQSNSDNNTTNPKDTKNEVEPDSYSVKILRDKNVKKGNIETKDDYINRQYIITIPGDYTAYYSENEPEQVDDSVQSITAELNSNGDTDLYIKTNTVRAFLVNETSDAIYVTVKAPKEVYKKIVVVDAGHGGTDPGTLGNALIEKNLTLSIVKYAKSYLDTESDLKVYYTRLEDFEKQITKGKTGDPIKTTGESLVARYNFANETQADLFISVHINSTYNLPEPRGTEVYYSSKNSRTNEYGMTSKKLADLCLPKMLAAVGSKNRKVKDDPKLAVLKNTKMPAILIEVAFISNVEDAAILSDESKKDEIGHAIFDTIDEAFE